MCAPLPTHAHPCYSNCAHVFKNCVMCITRIHQVLVGSDKYHSYAHPCTPKIHGHGWAWAWVWAPNVGLYYAPRGKNGLHKRKYEHIIGESWNLIHASIRGACEVKWHHFFSPMPRVCEYQHKVTQVFLMFKLPYTKNGVSWSKTNFIGCPIRMGGSS